MFTKKITASKNKVNSFFKLCSIKIDNTSTNVRRNSIL